MDNNKISRLVSELFKDINSKEDFDSISNLLVNSLSVYKKRFQIESHAENKTSSLNKIYNNEFRNAEYVVSKPEDEYLAISNDLHAILSSCSEFSNSQKLDFCNNQRYFMKKYLKELIIKLNLV